MPEVQIFTVLKKMLHFNSSLERQTLNRAVDSNISKFLKKVFQKYLKYFKKCLKYFRDI